MDSLDILAMRGGHKPIATGTDYTDTDYHFYGFIPSENTTITTLKMGDNDLSSSVSGHTYYAGVYYGLPAKVTPGYGTDITLATGAVALVLTLDSPNHY